MRRDFFTGKKVLVMGLGRFGGGADVAEFAAGAGASVTVTDLATADQLGDSISKLEKFVGIEFHLGAHDPADFEQADIVVANPAVPRDSKFLQIARRAGRRVTSQINIFFELCPAQIIGITGANGKSTTAALTAHLLGSVSRLVSERKTVSSSGRMGNLLPIRKRTDQQHGQQVAHPTDCFLKSEAKKSQAPQYENVWLSGNIGNRPLLTTLDEIGPNDLVVLELSSFQLEQLAEIQKAPQAALLTNLTPNHLDRHGTFANYCAAKENIFKFQQLDDDSPAISIFNAEDEVGAEWYEKYRNDAGRTCVRFSADDISAEFSRVFPLPGRANRSNLAAAIAVVRNFGVDDEQIESCLPSFKSLPHRLEFVAEINGVRWYNDSIATTPQSTIAALEAFDEPVIIIAGGYDKKLPFDELGRKIAQKAKAAILIGQTAPKIAAAIQRELATEATEVTEKKTEVETVSSLAKAVTQARDLATPGFVVLLSPACASYDMFDNFQQRGLEFTRLVRELNG